MEQGSDRKGQEAICGAPEGNRHEGIQGGGQETIGGGGGEEKEEEAVDMREVCWNWVPNQPKPA